MAGVPSLSARRFAQRLCASASVSPRGIDLRLSCPASDALCPPGRGSRFHLWAGLGFGESQRTVHRRAPAIFGSGRTQSKELACSSLSSHAAA